MPENQPATQTPRANRTASKTRAITQAARESFLQDGYAGSSMDVIARSANVSVKTIYSHFQNKDTLFEDVMIGVCDEQLFSGAPLPDALLDERFPWFSDLTERGLASAGEAYLLHLLSDDQVALYRVVTRDAVQFPELGRHYQRHVAQGRRWILTAYFERLLRALEQPQEQASRHAEMYEGLLRIPLFEDVLHGLTQAGPQRITQQALKAAELLWKIVTPHYRSSGK